MITVPKVPKEIHSGRIKLKKCLYPDCQNLFQGRGFSKYCEEHRQRQYRKVIDKLNKKIIITENPNQTYRHDHSVITMITFTCVLCGSEFELRIYPNIYIYPKYCEDHRNLFKRTLWLKRNSIYVPPIKNPITEDTDIVIGGLPPDMPQLKDIIDEDTFIDDGDIDLIEEREL